MHGVEAFVLAVGVGATAARLTEVDVAGQLAKDEDVEPGNDLRLERGGRRQRFIGQGRTQVGEQAQVLADAEDAALGPQLAWQVVVLRPAHGTHENGIGGAGRLLRGFGIGAAFGIDRRAAQQAERPTQVFAFMFQQFQHLDRLGDDLGADAVAGQDEDVLAHVASRQS